MTDTIDILKAIETIKSDVGNIKKDMATKADIQRVEKGQSETNASLAQNTTILKAVAAGQNELQKIVAKEADLLDLQSDLGKKVKDHEVRIENLEDHTGTHNPHKN